MIAVMAANARRTLKNILRFSNGVEILVQDEDLRGLLVEIRT